MSAEENRTVLTMDGKALFTQGELGTIKAFLADPGWPLVVRLCQALVDSAKNECLDPKGNIHVVNRCRGRAEGLSEFLGLMHAGVPALYKRMIEALEQSKNPPKPTEEP